ncbi:S9 family peptidase [Microlunatus speluncae]|uniref:S9 family peptidase n=1 Tax=Microlunatus speluncae TaxID=2594267 RepID=UPI0012662E69|nr:DPP IV N-terminal domain-containing protein [Microlunatus speluncae]
MYDEDSYRRAAGFLPDRVIDAISGLAGPVRWADDSSLAWYRVTTAPGWRYVAVDPATGEQRPAFNHDQLAAALGADPTRLAIDDLTWVGGPTGDHHRRPSTGSGNDHPNVPTDRPSRDRTLQTADSLEGQAGSGSFPELVEGQARWEFTHEDTRWHCDPDGADARRLTDDERDAAPSPDGLHTAFTRDHDLWLRDHRTGVERRLTDDGTAEAYYGRPVPSPLRAAGLPGAGQPWRETAALWSPDGRLLITHRMHTAGAGRLTMTRSTRPLGVRPDAVDYLYPLPGDEHPPRAELIIVDTESGRIAPVGLSPIEQLYYGSPIPRAGQRSRRLWWSPDGAAVYLLWSSRGCLRLVLYRIDARTGAATVLAEEEAETPVDPNLTTSGSPNVAVLSGGREVIWYSHRDGWGHLYLHDVETDGPARRLTTGDWAVADLVHVDEDTRTVWFTAMGRAGDPYWRQLCRVGLDGGEPELITPEDADQSVSFAPDGSTFTVSRAGLDSAPVLDLCRPDGTTISTLERGDHQRLLDRGWTYPERLVATARDGVTEIRGVIIRPTDFDPAHRYPVIDAIYAGPQTNVAPASFADLDEKHAYWQAQAIAELGFVVVMIDGLGMPYRSREFRDLSYRNLGDAGLPDHRAALSQLAERYPQLDLDRVGIYGHSAGGYASARAMLAHPDFYRVGVSSAGNHDHRLDKAWWIERYQGWPVGDHYTDQANRTQAHRLQGKLLLIHGELDENVPVAATLSLAEALVAADKDFDLLILPGRPHACAADPYLVRRRWDYFVRHLAGTEPPSYSITQGAPSVP